MNLNFSVPLTFLAIVFTAYFAHDAHADVNLNGREAIEGMSGGYTTTSTDSLVLELNGVGGNRITDRMGASIAKTGGSVTIDGNGILRIIADSADVVGIADVPQRTVNLSLGSGALIDIQGGVLVNGGWGGGVWSSNLADMNIAAGAVFDVWDGSNHIRIDALNGSGSIQNGSNSGSMRFVTVGVDGGSGNFSGVIGGGTNRAGHNQISFTKDGSGTQILSGNHTYVGTTTVTQGTLVIEGSHTSSSLTTVASGATLAGSGTVGSLTTDVGGILQPGSAIGRLGIAGDYTHRGTLAMEVHGLVAGSQHDQLVIARSGGNALVSLSGGLSVSFGPSYLPSLSDLVFIVTNDSNDAIDGTFAGFPQNSVVTRFGGFDWQISYTADVSAGSYTGGNDIALRAIPESTGFDATQYEAGLTFRLYDIQEQMDQLYPLVPGQTPNVDEKRATIDWSGSANFAGYTQQFFVECFASLNISDQGTYEFRMTSDDGSELWIGDQVLIDNDGVHDAIPQNGSISLTAGLHPLKIRFFQNTGGSVLKLEWRPPGAVDFVIVPSTAFLTTAGVTRVVAPGKKEIITPGEDVRPGNGLPLNAVHPSWEVQTIHPASFQPKVGAMAVHPSDGRLFIATFDPNQFSTPAPLPGGDGKVWVLSNTQANDPEAVAVTEVASGLSEPLGMAFINGELYVSQRTAITRLSDTNGDGYFETKTAIGGGWISDNYHHFHFGLIERDGFTYSTLSTAINFSYPGINGPNPPNRGTLVRTNLATGEVSYLAGGLRTPNGLCFGPEGEIFQTDNQGSWMPASRLNHLQSGRFYGHYNSTADGGSPSLFADQPATPPAVWFPQNEIANSPSQPISIPDGPYAGDLLVGDITLGGINRVSLEKVHGVWQGCIYRFTQGLAGGVNRLAWGPNGSLYIGCIGGTGNWSWNGTTTGLQRLSPKSSASTTFEIAKVSATKTGFEITYTKPIPLTFLENPANYAVRQWTYQATVDYGGPKIGEEVLTVSSAKSSADRTRVSLSIPGLKEGHVVHLKSDPLADDGSIILSTEAWYTLNEIPGGPFGLTLDRNTVAENQTVASVVGSLSASHENREERLIYSLPAGVMDNASFLIDDTKLAIAAPFDYERRRSYQVRIRATDSAGLFTEADFVITVADIAEENSPRNIQLTNAVLPLDHQAGALVGRLMIDDADLGDLVEISQQQLETTAIVEESFNYPVATDLFGQNRGNGFSDAWQSISGNAMVSSRSLAYIDPSGLMLKSSGNHGIASANSRLHRPLAASRGTDGTTSYVSFIADPGNNVYFWGIEFWNGSAGDANRVIQIGNELGFGVRVRNGSNKFFAMNDARSHFFVVKIEHLPGNDRVSVWIDPSLAEEPEDPDLHFSPDETGGSIVFNRVGLSDFVDTSAPALDELRIGDDWRSVTPHQLSYPIFELVAGDGDEDNPFFTITGDRVTTVSALAPGLQRIRVRATDSSGKSSEKPLLIWVGAGHLDSNNDGIDDATSIRLGFDPQSLISIDAYFGRGGSHPSLRPSSGPRDFHLSSDTVPGNLYRVESSTDLVRWNFEPQSVVAPTSFLQSRMEWPVTRPNAPRYFWRVVGGWPTNQGENPLENGLTELTFVGGSAGWSYDATTGILRHDTAAPSDWLYFPGEYGDFLLSLDFRLSEGGNAGIFVRAATTGFPWVTGSEIQLTHEPRLPIHATGSLYDRIPAEPTADNQHSIWHRIEVLMIGGRVRVSVDGVITVDEADVRETYPSIPWSERGVIGLQNSHAAAPGSIEFRNIRIISLDP